MLATLLTWLINLWRGARNAWRRLLHRRPYWVRLEISGALPEFAEPIGRWRRLLGAQEPLSLQSLRRRLERLADDPHARGALLIIGDLGAGWATTQSFQEILKNLHASGKGVVAQLSGADTRAYLAACAADRIVMPPTAYLNLLGVRAEAQFLADSLRLAGVEAEVIAVSPYKSGGDQLARAEISPEARAQLERLVEQRYELVVRGIADARGISDDEVRRLIDTAPHRASPAAEAGLLDAALYDDEIEAYLRAYGGEPAAGAPAPALIEWGSAARRMPLPMLRRERRHIGVVSVTGAITAGPSRRSPLPLPIFGGAMAGSDSVSQALRRAERDRRLAALVLHIDSPGGDSFASDLIWREVLRVAKGRPVVVSMGDAAASGGYYIAAPARAIVAQPATLTGSIGVYAVRPNLSGLLEKAEVGTAVIARGARSGLFSPLAAMSDEERAALRRTVGETYSAFKERVRAGRGLSEERLEPIAGGRVWSGAEAAQLGLVDVLGGLPTAVAKARELAGLPADERAPLVLYRGGRGQSAPKPFADPPDPPAALAALLGDALRPRILAALPWVLWER
jgi:protease-4